jgi:hypothetical protein
LVRSVWIVPGARTFIVTPSFATSPDIVLSQAQIEARSVLLSARFGIGCCMPVLPPR